MNLKNHWPPCIWTNKKVSSVTSKRSEQYRTHFILLGLSSATEHLRKELHKCQVLLIVSLLLVMKAKNIYQSTTKIHKTMEQGSTIKKKLCSWPQGCALPSPQMSYRKIQNMHFDCVPIYIFGFHHKQCASD